MELFLKTDLARNRILAQCRMTLLFSLLFVDAVEELVANRDLLGCHELLVWVCARLKERLADTSRLDSR